MPTAGYIAGPLHAYWIAEKITKVLLGKDKVARFGKAGYKLVIGEVSLERQAARYERFFEKGAQLS
jgi:hypothetical protein